MNKRIFTSNYDQCLAGNRISISKDCGRSKGFNGKVILDLAPKEEFFRKWRNNIGNIPEEENTRFYIREYCKQVLLNVDIEELLKDEKDPILLCYEIGDAFCHRHVVAEFINIRYGIDVKDIMIDEDLNITVNKRPKYIREMLEETLIELLPDIKDKVLREKVKEIEERRKTKNMEI